MVHKTEYVDEGEDCTQTGWQSSGEPVHYAQYRPIERWKEDQVSVQDSKIHPRDLLGRNVQCHLTQAQPLAHLEPRRLL